MKLLLIQYSSHTCWFTIWWSRLPFVTDAAFVWARLATRIYQRKKWNIYWSDCLYFQNENAPDFETKHFPAILFTSIWKSIVWKCPISFMAPSIVQVIRIKKPRNWNVIFLCDVQIDIKLSDDLKMWSGHQALIWPSNQNCLFIYT